MPTLIAICGTVGSGKSTLTEQLAAHLGWRSIAVEDRSSSYLEDMFRQPRRWSFEAQMSYLARKALGIMSHNSEQVPALLDRALEEDIDVFARYWAEQGALDARAFDLYRDLARLMTEVLPDPFAYVLCKADAGLSRARLAQRSPQPDGKLVLDVERLAEMYHQWWRDLDSPRKLELDSEQLDFRDPAVVEVVADKLVALGVPGSAEQLELLAGRPRGGRTVAATGSLPVSQDSPQIYLAGPFTAVTVEENDGIQDRLFASPRQVMSRGSYWRKIFEETAHSLESQGWKVFLPHRDVSRWGSRALTAQSVAEECIAAVKASDAVVAVPGVSFGTHVELGVALGRRIPTVLVRCPGLEMSFFTDGLARSAAVGEIAVEDLASLPSMVAGKGFRQVLEAAFAGIRSSGT